jgi:hypothetical protein
MCPVYVLPARAFNVNVLDDEIWMRAGADQLRGTQDVHQAFSRLQERADGTKEIGNLTISPTVLGYGSSTHGTIVFAGDFGGRPVAVKRLLVEFHDVALKEVDALIASDEHPNVLRYGFCHFGFISQFHWHLLGTFSLLHLI